MSRVLRYSACNMTAASTKLKPAVVPGIALEFMPLEQALKILRMSHVDLLRIMAASPDWPFPATLNGWKLSHDAIRYDMDVILLALETAKTLLLVRGEALADWQVEALHSVVRTFYSRVHQQLSHKRRTLLPWLGTRVGVPPLMMDYDEAMMVELLDRVRALCEGISPPVAATAAAKIAVRDLHSAFVVLRTLMRQQMEREELLGLPLLRKHFTAREAAAVEKKMVCNMKAADLAWLLRPLAMAEKREALARLGFPGLVQRLLVLPSLRRADRAALRFHRELVAGERLGPQHDLSGAEEEEED